MVKLKKINSARKDELRLSGKFVSKEVEIDLDEDDYDSEGSFSRRWDKSEKEMLIGDTLTQSEFFQRIRERIKQ